MSAEVPLQEVAAGVKASVSPSPLTPLVGDVGTPGWLTILKGLLYLVPKLWGVFESLGKLSADKKFNAWLDELEKTTKEIERATSLRDRIEAARRLSDLTRRL